MNSQNKFNSMDLKVNERIQFTDKSLATIRYVGHIEPWGNDIIALGVEWDDRTRGKHNGTLDGVQYFATEVNGAGSFIKHTNKKLIVKRKSFEESLTENYGQENNQITDCLKIGSKEVESLGFDKLNRINSNFSNLKSITLDFKCIYKIDSNINILGSLKNLQKLDLSFNLFTDISEIWKIIDCIPNIEELNLNGNRFNKISISKKTHGLKILRLSNTKIKFKDIFGYILPKFPKLEELTVASNDYTDDDLIYSNQELRSIDLSFNRLTKIPFIKAANMNLINNSISEIDSTNIPEIVDLRYNAINSWDFIDSLSKAENLKDIKITNNPLFSTMNEDDITVNLIGRIKCVGAQSQQGGVQRVNGSELLQQEIDNAELYFISKVRKGEYHVSDNNKNWKRLKLKYNIEDKQPDTRLNELAYSRLLVKILLNDEVISQRNFTKSTRVLRLKGYVSNLLHKKLMDFLLKHRITNDVEQILDDDNMRLGDFGFAEEDEIIINLF